MADPTWDETSEAQTSAPSWDETVPHEAYTGMQSALMGGLNQLNAAPVLGAAAQSPLQAFKKAINPLARLAGASESKPEDTKDFDEDRQTLNSKFKQAQSNNPKSYLAGNVAGSIPLMALAPESAPGILGGLKTGAAIGAASGAGEALSSGQSVGGVAGQALGGAATGGLVGGVLGGAASALTPEALEATAASQGLKAVAPAKSDIRKIMTSAGAGPDALQDAGETLIKPSQWLNGKSIVQAGAGKEDILNNVQQAMQRSGQFIGGMADTADSMGKKVVDTNDAVDFIDKALAKMVSPNPDKEGVALNTYKDAFDTLYGIKQDIQDIGGTGAPISFQDSQKILKVIDDAAYNQDGTVANQDLNKLRGIFNGNIEDGLEQVSKDSGSNLYDQFKDAKDMYRTTKLISKAAEGGVAKDVSNQTLGLTDYIAGGIGHAVGGNPLGLAAAAANYGVRNYGNAIAAKAAQGLANGMNSIGNKVSAVGSGISAGMDVVQQKTPPLAGKILTSATPETLQNWATTAAASSNPTMQGLGRIFKEAAGRDQIGRNALMFTVLQNPTYRDALHSVTSSDESNK